MRMLWVTMGMYVPFVAPSVTRWLELPGRGHPVSVTDHD